MKDLEIIILSIIPKCVQIDSKFLIASKLKKDYSNPIKDLLPSTKFIKRRKRSTENIKHCLRSSLQIWYTNLQNRISK